MANKRAPTTFIDPFKRLRFDKSRVSVEDMKPFKARPGPARALRYKLNSARLRQAKKIVQRSAIIGFRHWYTL
ncbi:MAG TPA: hypothetical protein VIG52_10290, partial [Methyloceanibacter sp.]